MKRSVKQKRRKKQTAVFHPCELVILAHYLGKRGVLPVELRATPLPKPVASHEVDERNTGIVLQLDASGEKSELTIPNAVARICLASIQDELPQWGVYDGETVKFGRTLVPISKLPARELKPQLLFEINWTDSGPGFSWPEQYRVTAVPYFKVQVVTASDDSPDALGYCDFAIGWFNDSDGLLQGAERVICDYWSNRAEEGGEPWEEFWAEGLVTKTLANAWARVAWGIDGDGKPLPRGPYLGFHTLTPMHAAIASGREELVKKLLGEEADLKCDHGLGMAALHLAALHGCARIVRLLLAHGADPLQKDAGGRTPLQVATAEHRLGAAKVLKEWMKGHQSKRSIKSERKRRKHAD